MTMRQHVCNFGLVQACNPRFHVYFGDIYISYPFSLASLVFGCVVAD